MSTVKKICDAVGRSRIAEIVGVKKAAVTNAIYQGQFPASWFLALRAECEDREIDLPESLFSFKAHEPDKTSEDAA